MTPMTSKNLNASQTSQGTSGLFAKLPPPQLAPLAELPPLSVGPVPPPLVNQIELAFPPEGPRQAAPRVALPRPEIVRVAPEGDAGTQGTVTVAFSQPMIALASVGQVNAGPLPLGLTPAKAGKARWVDPKTFVLEAEGRLAYSTTYRASVAAGLPAADGQTLAQGQSWTFTTQLAQELVESRPWNGASGLGLDLVLQLRFRGVMEARLAVDGLRLEEAATHKRLAIDLLPGLAQGAAGSEAKPLVPGWEPQYSLGIRPHAKLKPGTAYRLVLSTSLASPEGPNRPLEAQVVGFETYAPFALEELQCSQRDTGECQPGSQVVANFNNQLEPGQDLSRFASVSPAPDDLQLIAGGQSIMFQGTFEPSTAYTFRIKPGLRDTFGQTLAKGLTRKLHFAAFDPALRLEGEGSIVVIESEVSRKLWVDTVNVPQFTVRSARPDAGTWERAELWVSPWSSESKLPLAKLPEQTRQTFTPEGAPNAPVRTELELVKLLGGQRYGAALVEVTARHGRPVEERAARALVQVTDLSVLALASPERLHVEVSRFSSGEAVARARIEVRSNAGKLVLSGATDPQGLLDLTGPRGVTEPDVPWTLVVESSDDRVMLPLRGGTIGGGLSMISSASYLTAPAPMLVATSFADRGIYRPGETAHVTLVARQQSSGTRGELLALPPELFKWEFQGPRGELSKGEVTTDAFGIAAVELALAGPELGQHFLTFKRAAGGETAATAAFRVEEYRPPEFLAKAVIQAPSPAFLRTEAEATVSGRYLFGAPMAGASVQWRVNRLEADWAPPGWDTFTFRRIERFRGWHEGWGGRPWGRDNEGVQVAAGTGALDAQGTLALRFKLEGEGFTQAQRFTLSTTVTDKNRQAGGAVASVLAHPSQIYVGVRVSTTVVPVGGQVEAELVATRVDGRLLAQQPITLSLVHEAWGGQAQARPITQEVVSGAAPVKAALTPTQAGAWTLTATAHDGQGGSHVASVPVWVVGPDFKQDGTPQLQIVLDKTSYAPGDTVRALVLSPFPRSRGSWALGREGFLAVHPLALEGTSTLLTFTAEDAWVPNAELVVALAQPRVKPPGEKDDDGRPKLVTASTTIRVDKRQRTLDVKVSPQKPTTAPATEALVSFEVLDALGHGRAANLTVMVVDEGVLAMTGFLTPVLIDALYPQRGSGVGGASTASSVLPRQPHDFAAELREQRSHGGRNGSRDKRSMARAAPPTEAMAAPMKSERADGADAGSPTEGPSFAVRQTFSSAPYFKADVRTDSSGKASVRFKLPDNLTEFRVMAVAADEARSFGAGEARIVVRQPVLVRPALPRFLNVGDAFEAAAVVHNETGEEAELEVICRAANAQVHGESQRIHLTSGASTEVRFHAEAGAPGPARFQFAAVALTAERPTDAAEVTIPTQLPATAEAFASYGQTETATKLAVELPTDPLPGYGGLQLQLSSTALTGLSDAIDYLVDYPFGCAEQTASRILPLAALKDVLVSLKLASVANEQKRVKLLDEAVSHLLTLQRSDGGFGLWASSERSGLWLSAYSLLALDLAQRAGAAMPARASDQVSAAIRYLTERLAKPLARDWDDSDEARSLAVLVLSRRGFAPVPEIQRLMGQKNLALFAVAWTMQAAALGRRPGAAGDNAQRAVNETLAAVVKLGLRRLGNAAVESAGAIHFAERTSESLRLLMHSDDRTDGIVLGALLAARAQEARASEALIDKTMRGLMRLRAKGHWSTTQSNAWALVALSDYFRQYEAAEPDFLARLWFGDAQLVAQPFRGRSTAVASGTVPFAKLGGPKGTLVIAKEGPGRLYYRVGLRYAPMNLDLKPLDQGFIVSRTYEALKDPADVKLGADGAFHVRAGATVRVRLKLTSPDRRYYAALVDPLPAGFEILDTSLATAAKETDPGPSASPRPWWYYWSPWSHTELKDDRLHLFADTLNAGDLEHTYLVRATTPGRFVAPPARAEEMYAPETFGRGKTDRVVIE